MTASRLPMPPPPANQWYTHLATDSFSFYAVNAAGAVVLWTETDLTERVGNPMAGSTPKKAADGQPTQPVRQVVAPVELLDASMAVSGCELENA